MQRYVGHKNLDSPKTIKRKKQIREWKNLFSYRKDWHLIERKTIDDGRYIGSNNLHGSSIQYSRCSLEEKKTEGDIFLERNSCVSWRRQRKRSFTKESVRESHDRIVDGMRMIIKRMYVHYTIGQRQQGYDKSGLYFAESNFEKQSL